MSKQMFWDQQEKEEAEEAALWLKAKEEQAKAPTRFVLDCSKANKKIAEDITPLPF